MNPFFTKGDSGVSIVFKRKKEKKKRDLKRVREVIVQSEDPSLASEVLAWGGWRVVTTFVVRICIYSCASWQYLCFTSGLSLIGHFFFWLFYFKLSQVALIEVD